MTRYLKKRGSTISHETLEARHLLTTLSTTLLASFSSNGETAELSDFSPIGEHIYFDVNESEVWRTDGTSEGTTRLAEVNRVGDPIQVGPGLELFEVQIQNGTSIWRTDGTVEGTFELLRNQSLHRSSGRFASTASAHGVNYFIAEKNDELELYRTDGTAAGTERMSSRVAQEIVVYNDEVYFVGTSDGTQHIHKIADANSDPEQFVPLNSVFDRGVAATLTVVNDKLVFFDVDLSIDSSPGHVFARPWVTDGTVEGTFPLTDQSARYFTWTPHSEGAVVNDVFVYFVDRFGLFRTDGTPEGTYQMDSVNTDTIRFVGTADGHAYFTHSEMFGEHFTLVATDGVSESQLSRLGWGWVERFDDDSIVVYSSDNDGPHGIYVIIDNVPTYIRARNAPPLVDLQAGNVGDVWYYDGEPFLQRGSTGRVIIGDPESSVELPTIGGNILNNSESTLAFELYTKPSSSPLFTRDGNTLWALDGGFSPAKIADIDTAWANHRAQFHYADDAFYFTNETDETGREVWMSDGTPEGTLPFDAKLGTGSSEPELIYWEGKTLVVANEDDTSRSLWLLNATPSPIPTVDPGLYVIDEGTDLRLGVTTATNANAFRWDVDGDGEYDDATGPDPTLTWEMLTNLKPSFGVGVHEIGLEVETDSGELLYEVAAVSVVNLTPVLNSNLPTSLATGTAFEINVDVVDAGDLRYTLDFGDGTRVSQSSPIFSHTYNNSAIYPLRLTVSDGDGGVVTASNMVAVNHEDPTLSWFFESHERFGAADRSVDVDFVDTDQDGSVDAVLETIQGGQQDRFWHLDGFSFGSSLFRRQSFLASDRQGRSIYSAVGDLDGDGISDVVVTSLDGAKVHYCGILCRDATVPIGDQTIKSYDVAIGDLDGDGDQDLYVANFQDANNQPAPDRVFFNDGERTFTESAQALGNFESRSVELGDLDGDGDLDAVVGGLTSQTSRIWWNDGQGTFVPDDQVDHSGEHIAIGDLDSDGDLDLFGVTNNANIVWLNDGSGNFVDSEQRLGDRLSSHVALGDLDNDGDLDAFVANWEGHANTLWLNDGAGRFLDSGTRLAKEISTEHVALGDMDRDGDLDVVTSSWGASNFVYINAFPEAPVPQPSLQGDANGDLSVNFADFLILSQNFGRETDEAFADGDFNGDGLISFADFLLLSNHFGHTA